MPQHLIILTGASRGMGLAMAHQLLHPDNTLLCISRTANPLLAREAANTGATLLQWEQDLAHAEQAAQRLRDWLQGSLAEHFASATLINNAGVMPPIAPLSASVPGDLAVALRVGLEAPMLLCASFLGATEGWNLPRKVLNISSGLGRRPMASFHTLHGTGRRAQAARCAGLLARAGRDRYRHAAAIALGPPGCFPGCAELCPAPARRHAQQCTRCGYAGSRLARAPRLWRPSSRRCTGCLNRHRYIFYSCNRSSILRKTCFLP